MVSQDMIPGARLPKTTKAIFQSVFLAVATEPELAGCHHRKPHRARNTSLFPSVPGGRGKHQQISPYIGLCKISLMQLTSPNQILYNRYL